MLGNRYPPLLQKKYKKLNDAQEKILFYHHVMPVRLIM